MKEIEAWVTRDRNGKPYLYRVKPIKFSNMWLAEHEYTEGINFMRLADDSFPEVQWSDAEPTKVKITIEK